MSSPSMDLGVILDAVQFTILLYDFVLTLDGEVELFWKRPRRSWPFVLFLANRYIVVLGNLPAMAYAFVRLSDSWCHSLRLFGELRIVAVQVVGGVLMTIRVYVLYNQSRSILTLLLMIALGAISISCWAMVRFPSPKSNMSDFLPPSRMVGCPGGLYMTPEQGRYMAAAWSGQLVFDIIVFLLTLWQCLQTRMKGYKDLMGVFLRDGCIYFAVIAVANAVNITVLLVATDYLKGGATGPMNVLSAVMISRLMLKLRHSYRASGTCSAQLGSHISRSLEFVGGPGAATVETMSAA